LLSGGRANAYYGGPASDHFDGVRFFNPGGARPRGPGAFLKWQLGDRGEAWPRSFPSPFPADSPPARFEGEGVRIVYVGHATFLMQARGKNVLIDPVWSERASPVSFVGPKRVNPPGIEFDRLPPIDVVLVTHNHYDHLDDATVRALAAQPGGPPRFYVPLGVDAWFAARNLPVQATMDWWDRREDAGLDIHFVPAQHWSARSLIDRNETLWGGFVVEAQGFRFIATGDTGYSQDYRDIAARFGSFDLAAIPIGGYAPRWFMAPQHVDPDEAVAIHRDLNARHSLGVHWGTFVLTDEPLDEPPQRTRAAALAAGLAADEFWVFRHGETRRLGTAGPLVRTAAMR
jgi:L-ascorbate metabolism protein UlaG (beta-lactamase superfamily)